MSGTLDPEYHRPEGMEMAGRVEGVRPRQDESWLEAYREGWGDALRWAIGKDDGELIEVLEADEAA